MEQPYIIGLGGTLRANSSTEKALKVALTHAQWLGAKTLLIGGPELDMPHYAPDQPDRAARAVHLVEEVAKADGILIGSPGYHGGVSGLVKNALDHLEELRSHSSPYLSGRAVACIATGAGAQGAAAALTNLRSIVHALRGWPTPLGLAINTLEISFAPDGRCEDPKVQLMLETAAQEVVGFALARNALARAQQ